MNKLESKADIDINDMIRCANEFHIISQNKKLLYQILLSWHLLVNYT